jgi:predicted TIM-barrel fold metal-dependent hydrolase
MGNQGRGGMTIDFHNHIWLPGDPDGDGLLRAMDEQGIERMLLHACPTDIWSYTGDNDDIARAVRKHPDRLMGTMHLDFRDGAEACRERIRRYAGEGLCGAKMFPSLGFAPDAAASLPVYAALEEHGLFAAFHLGYLAPSDVRQVPMSSRHAMAFSLELPATTFPGLRFVCCHMGGNPGYEQALCLIRYYRNVWADLAPGHGIEAFRFMGKLIEIVAWDKIMWGSDAGPEQWAAQFDFWHAHAAENGYTERLPALMRENALRFMAWETAAPRQAD